MAGLIAGPRGVAPDAEIHDFKVYDSDTADISQGQKQLTSAGIVAGIEAVLSAYPREKFDVVNISLAVRTPDPKLEAAVARLVELPLVVVAAAGNVEEDSSDAASAKGTPGNDADVYPADYPGVLAVERDPARQRGPQHLRGAQHGHRRLRAHPGRDLRSTPPGRCATSARSRRRGPPRRSSGILALLREQFPRETPQQLVARLQATTEGGGPAAEGGVDDPWTGAGVVQAYDALTRELAPGRQGRIESTVAETRTDAVAPPAPEQDRPVQHPARHPAVVGTGRRRAARAGVHAAPLAATVSRRPFSRPAPTRVMESTS